MNTNAMPTPHNKSMFDLLTPFAESTDARLRGNAAHAYAALVESSPHPEVRERARERLIELVATGAHGSGAAGMEWERRFAERALEAFQQLPPATFDDCSQRLLDRALNTEAPEQRRTLSRFFLSLNEIAARQLRIGWLKTQQLLRGAGRPGVGLSLFASAWRSLLVWVGLLVVLTSSLDNFKSSRFDDIAMLSIGACMVLVLASTVSQFRHAWRIGAIDIALCAAVMGMLGAASMAVLRDDTEQPAAAMALGTALGLVLGAALRARRWLPAALKADMFRSLAAWEPVIVFAATTLLCMAASMLSGKPQTAGLCWMVLAPTAVVVSWQDGWLVRHGPQSLQPRPATPIHPVWAYGPAAAVVLGAGLLAAYNWNKAYPWKAAPVAVPDAPQPAVPAPLELALGSQRHVELASPGRYRFSAGPRVAGSTVTLHIVAPREVPDPDPASSRGDQPATIEQEFPKGSYEVCVAPQGRDLCGHPHSMVTLGAAVVGGGTRATLTVEPVAVPIPGPAPTN